VERSSLTQISQQNLLPAYHQFWMNVCTFGLGLMVALALVMTIAMMMIGMVMVLVIVITVLKALRQVDWLHQRQHRSFHRLRAFS